MTFAPGRIGRLLKFSLIAVLALSTVGILSMYPVTVLGHKCQLSFTVTLSPSTETIPRGSNFRFTIFTSGPECLTGTHVGLFPSISPSVTNGPSFRTTSYAIPLYDSPWLVGNASQSTPTGTYTFTVTAKGQQAPLVGVTESGSATLTVT
ncbi:MAG TPA: hypothetical protein VNA15_03710 [Candidatus Angelobacter sp.]|nr:hypothetical protein [Candidatus Angelobacter sp.]